MADTGDGVVLAKMRRINETWLRGGVDDLREFVHPEITMVFPRFAGKATGKDEFIAGFREFLQAAHVHQFLDSDYECDIAGETAVVSFRYEMTYERNNERFAVTGRDLWVFQAIDSNWIAVWRTMLDLDEKPLDSVNGN